MYSSKRSKAISHSRRVVLTEIRPTSRRSNGLSCAGTIFSDYYTITKDDYRHMTSTLTFDRNLLIIVPFYHNKSTVDVFKDKSEVDFASVSEIKGGWAADRPP